MFLQKSCPECGGIVLHARETGAMVLHMACDAMRHTCTLAFHERRKTQQSTCNIVVQPHQWRRLLWRSIANA